MNDDFGAVRWRPWAYAVVLVLYGAAWLLVGQFWRGWLAPWCDNFPDIDDATFWEYGSLVVSALVKAAAAAAVVVLAVVSRTPARALGVRQGWAGWIFLVLWVALLAGSLARGLAVPDGQASSRSGDPPLTSGLVLTTLLLRGVLNPVSEEIIFRAGLYLTLRSRLGVGWGAVGAVLVFAAWHYNGGVVQMSVAAVMGGLLVLLYERSQSLPATYLAHSCVNVARLWLALNRGHL